MDMVGAVNEGNKLVSILFIVYRKAYICFHIYIDVNSARNTNSEHHVMRKLYTDMLSEFPPYAFYGIVNLI